MHCIWHPPKVPKNVRVKGRYSSTTIKEKATFLVRLPDFASSKAVKVTALMESNNKVVGRHDIIFGLGLFEYPRTPGMLSSFFCHLNQHTNSVYLGDSGSF